MLTQASTTFGLIHARTTPCNSTPRDRQKFLIPGIAEPMRLAKQGRSRIRSRIWLRSDFLGTNSWSKVGPISPR